MSANIQCGSIQILSATNPITRRTPQHRSCVKATSAIPPSLPRIISNGLAELKRTSYTRLSRSEIRAAAIMVIYRNISISITPSVAMTMMAVFDMSSDSLPSLRSDTMNVCALTSRSIPGRVPCPILSSLACVMASSSLLDTPLSTATDGLPAEYSLRCGSRASIISRGNTITASTPGWQMLSTATKLISSPSRLTRYGIRAPLGSTTPILRATSLDESHIVKDAIHPNPKAITTGNANV